MPGTSRFSFKSIALLLVAASLAGCHDSANEPTGAEDAIVLVTAVRAGVTPFIAFVDLDATNTGSMTDVRFSIVPRQNSVSRAVTANYPMSYLQRRGYVSSDVVTLPVFGLYAGFSNQVDVSMRYDDGSVMNMRVEILTEPYDDPGGIYASPNIRRARTPADGLDFHYFYMQSAISSPVIVDTDGEIRWVVPAPASSFSTLLHENGFVIGDPALPKLRRIELDGTTVDLTPAGYDFTRFHHTLDPGKVGMLAQLDTTLNGVQIIESTLVEMDPETGVILKQWEFGDILSRHMSSRGDDPGAFVRPGIDWFHTNAAAYDPRDDTLVVSSRENFVIKVRYSDGAVVWILGDPTKYWYTFPSLAAMSLTMNEGHFYPIGQHAVSISQDGHLLLFNNGFASLNQPAGTSRGENRTHSVISAYDIDAANLRAREVVRFDYGQSIYSDICSSAYETANGSQLISYAVADARTHARLVGLDPSRQVSFDFEYPTLSCNTSWNARPIAFESMQFVE